MTKPKKNWWKTKRATSVKRNGNTGTCQYHDTVVVEWTEDRIILDLNGYDTMTTRVRMNEVARYEDLSYNVYHHRGQTYVEYLEGHECNGRKATQPIGGDYQETVSFPRFQYYVEDCPDCAITKLGRLDND